VIPAVLYLIVTAFIPTSYTVQKRLILAKTTSVALPNHPTKYISLKEAVQSFQDTVFLSNYALSGLLKRLYIDTQLDVADPQLVSVYKLVKEHIHFKFEERNTLLIVSSGPELEVNKSVASFYVQFLKELVSQGLQRESNVASNKTPSKEASDFEFDEIQTAIIEHTDLMTPSRLLGLCYLLAIFVCVYLGLIVVIELSDCTFQSERQAAQYLDMELIGSIPNLEPIAQAFGQETRFTK
jgi:hypothetical protein